MCMIVPEYTARGNAARHFNNPLWRYNLLC
jgi:hypothetical protein